MSQKERFRCNRDGWEGLGNVPCSLLRVCSGREPALRFISWDSKKVLPDSLEFSWGRVTLYFPGGRALDRYQRGESSSLWFLLLLGFSAEKYQHENV